MFGETTRLADASLTEQIEGEAVMEGVEHIGQYVYDMQNAKFESLKASGGQLPTREINMGDAPVVQNDEDDDREENILLPEDAIDEDEELEVKASGGRHLEVEASSSVHIS